MTIQFNYNLNELRTKLYSAVLSDSLDAIGLFNQVLNPGIKPLDDRLNFSPRSSI